MEVSASPYKRFRDNYFKIYLFPSSLLNVLERLWHFPAPCLREEECEEARGDRHDGEDEGRYDGVDVSQSSHGGGQGPAELE